jgi:hypothetical protein
MDNHNIDLVGRELQPVARERVRQTQRHLLEVLGQHAGDEVRKILADSTEQIVGGRIRDGLDVEIRKLVDGAPKLALGDGQGDLLLVLELIEQAGQLGRNLALNDTSDFLERSSGTVEFGELLVLDPAGCWFANSGKEASCKLTP